MYDKSKPFTNSDQLASHIGAMLEDVFINRYGADWRAKPDSEQRYKLLTLRSKLLWKVYDIMVLEDV